MDTNDYWRGGWANNPGLMTQSLPGTQAAMLDQRTQGYYGPVNALADILGAYMQKRSTEGLISYVSKDLPKELDSLTAPEMSQAEREKYNFNVGAPQFKYGQPIQKPSPLTQNYDFLHKNGPGMELNPVMQAGNGAPDVMKALQDFAAMDPNLPQNRSLGYYNLNDAAKQAEPMIENAIQNCLKDYGGALLTAQRAKIDNYVQQLGDRVNTSAGQYGLLRILQEYNIAAQQMGQPVFDTNLIAQYMKSQKVTLTKSNVGDSVNWYITKADGGRFDDGSIIKPVMKEAVTMNPYQKGQLTLRTADLKEKQRHNLASEANARNRTAAAWYSATHKSLGGGGGGHSGGNSSKGGADSRISAASCTISSSTRRLFGTVSLCPQQWRRGPTRGAGRYMRTAKS